MAFGSLGQGYTAAMLPLICVGKNGEHKSAETKFSLGSLPSVVHFPPSTSLPPPSTHKSIQKVLPGGELKTYFFNGQNCAGSRLSTVYLISHLYACNLKAFSCALL